MVKVFPTVPLVRRPPPASPLAPATLPEMIVSVMVRLPVPWTKKSMPPPWAGGGFVRAGEWVGAGLPAGAPPTPPPGPAGDRVPGDHAVRDRQRPGRAADRVAEEDPAPAEGVAAEVAAGDGHARDAE